MLVCEQKPAIRYDLRGGAKDSLRLRAVSYFSFLRGVSEEAARNESGARGIEQRRTTAHGL